MCDCRNQDLAVRPPGSSGVVGLPLVVDPLKVGSGIPVTFGFLTDEETSEEITQDDGEELLMQ